MIFSDMVSTAPVSTRRRTNSVAAASDLSTKKKVPSSLQRPATEESNLLALGELPKPTRFRRSSFALSGERPTQLDGLVKEAAEHTAQMVASREAAKITTMVPLSPGVTQFHLDICNPVDTDSDDASRKVSVATLIPHSTGTSDKPVLMHSPSHSVRTSDSGWFLSENDNQHPFVWYNTKAFSQNPLSSELVKKYLAMIATESPSPEPDMLISASPPSGSGVMCGNLSGLMQLATSSVSSMTMPVHQIRRAHAMHARSPNAKLGILSYDLQPSARVACFSDRSAFTDTNYSSGVSDAEQWSQYHLGYQSDNYMRDAASEAKQLRMTGKRLEADYHRSTGSLPRIRKTRSRSKSGVLQGNALSPSTTPASVQSSKFDLMHVYEGLPVPGFSSSYPAGSTAASVASSTSRLPCDTPPCSPSTGSLLDSDHQNSLGSTNGLSRLRLFFDHWKPHIKDDDNGNYIYLDQEAQERRANARASNLIAPVSF